MKKEKSQKRGQKSTQQRITRYSHGGFKPGPWPNGGPPKVKNEPYPGHAPEGWSPNENRVTGK